jgi:ribosome-binding factor A
MIQKEITPLLNAFMSRFPGVMASVPFVRVSPDLMNIRVYISAFPDEKMEEVAAALNLHGWEIRKQLAAVIRNGVRKIPEIQYFPDDTVLYARKMEEIFSKIKPVPRTDKESDSTEEE